MKLSEHLSEWKYDEPEWHVMAEFIDFAKDLEQENARLKARLMNIEEGLKRVDDKLAYDRSPYAHDYNYLDYQNREWRIFDWDGNCLHKGKTIADLIDNILIDKQP